MKISGLVLDLLRELYLCGLNRTRVDVLLRFIPGDTSIWRKHMRTRNRLAHHETVLHWDLPKQHASILQLTAWLLPVAAEWSRNHCRFEKAYPKGGVDLAGGIPNAPEVAGPAV